MPISILHKYYHAFTDNEKRAYGVRLVVDADTLRGADLSEAQLDVSLLAGLDMRGCDLSHASLRQADMRNVNLCGSDLLDANLEKADLRGALLHRANVRAVKLEGALINWNSSELISAILWAAATNPDQQDFAVHGLNRKMCWDKLAAMNHPEAGWAISVLKKYLTDGCDAPACVREAAGV